MIKREYVCRKWMLRLCTLKFQHWPTPPLRCNACPDTQCDERNDILVMRLVEEQWHYSHRYRKNKIWHRVAPWIPTHGTSACPLQGNDTAKGQYIPESVHDSMLWKDERKENFKYYSHQIKCNAYIDKDEHSLIAMQGNEWKGPFWHVNLVLCVWSLF